MIRALILAAGLGSRLGSLSLQKPKPLLPVCNIPLIRFAIALCKRYGIDEIAINLHHQGTQIKAELGNGQNDGISIQYAEESTLLGTGGPIVNLYNFLSQSGKQPFYVINGKVLIDVDLQAVALQHEKTGAVATMVLRETQDARGWGSIETNDQGRVCKILDTGSPGSRLSMFTGVHFLTPEFARSLPPLPAASDSIRQGYQPLLQRGAPIFGYSHHGYFQEHSTPERYLTGNFRALAGEASSVASPGRFTGIAENAAVHPSTTLIAPYLIGAGATIAKHCTIGPFSVVGANARIQPSVSVSHCVVWANTDGSTNATNCIVTPTQLYRIST